MKKMYRTTTKRPIRSSGPMTENINRMHKAVGSAHKRLKEQTGQGCLCKRK